jgi:hypothetical protein
MQFRSFLCSALALSLIGLPAWGESTQSVRWSGLDALITGKRVWIPLKSGVRLSGTVQSVSSDAMQMDVRKTSNRKLYPKGLVSIPRAEVASLRLNKPPGHKGLIIGSSIGLGIGTTTGLTLGAIARNEGATGPWGLYAVSIAAPVALGVGLGVLADWLGSRGSRRIVVLPD